MSPQNQKSFPLVDGVLHAVRPEHLRVQDRLLQRGAAAQQHAVAVVPRSGDPVESLRQVEPADLQGRAPAFRDAQRSAPEAEPIRGELVAVAARVEEDRLAHQARFVEGYQPLAVRDAPHVVDRCQLHERHSPSCRLVNDRDGEMSAGRLDGREGNPGSEKYDGLEGDHEALKTGFFKLIFDIICRR